MEVSTKGANKPSVLRQSVAGSSQKRVQKDRSSAVSVIIPGGAKKIEQRREAVTMMDSELEGSPPRIDAALLYQDIHEYNVKVIHNYAKPYDDNVTGEVMDHHTKTAEWVFYHAFSLTKPTLINTPIDQQYTHTGGKNGQYACKICDIDKPPCSGHVFRSSVAIKEHLRYDHNREGRYSCKLCGETFKRPPGLYNHVQGKHYIEPERLESPAEIAVSKLEPSPVSLATHNSQSLKPSAGAPPLIFCPELAMPSTSGHVVPRIKIEVSDSPPPKRAKSNR